jgi:urate oxidase
MESAFLTGDNSNVVPTDTCKNTIYALGKKNDFDSIEQFGLIVCRHFLTEYPDIVNKVTIDISEDVWERIVAPDSRGVMKSHAHAFKRSGPATPFAKVSGTKRPSTSFSFSVKSGIRDLMVMKTTQSGFVDFHKCKYTSLVPATDRILGTSILAEWDYDNSSWESRPFPFNEVRSSMQDTMVNTLVGPADTGVYSKSVQETLFQMGEACLQEQPEVTKVPTPACTIYLIVSR